MKLNEESAAQIKLVGDRFFLGIVLRRLGWIATRSGDHALSLTHPGISNR